MSVRLNKHLADLGHASRRGAEKLIAEGRVKINGRIVTELSTQVDPDTDQVEVSEALAEVTLGYILNKPVGYVTTKGKEEGPAILDLLPKDAADMSYAGRLDKDSRGMVLMLADGKLSYAITRPGTHLEKEYWVRVEPYPRGAQLTKMKEGLPIDGKITKPVVIGEVQADRFRMVLTEGRKRQIRRMCEKVGLKVLELDRVRIGPIKITGLKEGQWRPVKAAEIEALQRAVVQAEKMGKITL